MTPFLFNAWHVNECASRFRYLRIWLYNDRFIVTQTTRLNFALAEGLNVLSFGEPYRKLSVSERQVTSPSYMQALLSALAVYSDYKSVL